MRTLPVIASARNIALVGGDFRPFLNTRDPVERLVERAVWDSVADRRQEWAEIERKNLASEVANGVGKHVSAALDNIARALRPR